jgi:HK97 family phage major capsid protein
MGTASYRPIFFGNFESGYAICERRQLVIARDAISSIVSGLVNILASIRIGGGIVNSESFLHLAHATA